MTDRFYPKGCVPDSGAMESTYNEANQMTTHDRSKFPPGYCGHEHGAGFKFGYSIPAPNQLPNEPIDPEDPLVNYRTGKKIFYEPLPSKKINLQTEEKAAEVMQATIKTVEAQKASITGETDMHLTFTPQTSDYLASINGNRASKVDKHQPYKPANPGEGSGFNSQSSFISWLPPGRLEGSSTTKDAFPVPASMRRGLDCLEYTTNVGNA